MKKHIVFIGGNIYKAGNIGDDAILLGIIKILEKLNSNFFYIIGTWEGKKIKLPINKKKYSCIDGCDFFEVAKAIKKSKYFIGGGGTLIGDELGFGFPLSYIAKLISIAKFFGKRVYFFAIGANKLKSQKGKKTLKRVYFLSDKIVLRDKQSFNICKEFIPKDKLATTADPAFLLERKETKRSFKIKKRFKKRRYFGVNTINESWYERRDYKIIIAKFCDYVSKKYGYIPVFFCNEIREGKFFDYRANKEVISYMGKESILLKPIYYSPEEMIDIISSFEFVLGMRMHVLIFASLTLTPFITVSRVDKVDNFMRQFGLEASCSIEKPILKNLKKDINDILNHKEKYKFQIKKGLAEAKKQAERNIFFFNLFLQKKKERFFKNFRLNYFSFKFLPKKEVIRVLFSEI